MIASQNPSDGRTLLHALAAAIVFKAGEDKESDEEESNNNDDYGNEDEDEDDDVDMPEADSEASMMKEIY